MADLRVLLCDDEAPLRDLMPRQLEKLGLEVERAEDGHDAIARLEQNRYDLLASDIYMPDVTGRELPQRMNALDPHAQSVASALDDVYLVVMMQDGYTGGVLTVSTYGEIPLASVQQVEDEQAINRSTYNHAVDWALAENSTRGRIIDSRFRAETTATAETQYAHIIALLCKPPGPAWGRGNEWRTSNS